MSASSSLQKYTVRVRKPENNIFKFFDPSRVFQRARACINIRFGSKNQKTTSSSFLPRAVYVSELEPCISASSSLQRYTARVKKQENNIFKFFAPRRVSQRPRACRDIRFGSENLKINIFKFFDPRHVFQRARACINIRFGSQNKKTRSSSFLTRAVYFSELELADIYGSGQKTGKQNLQVF